MIQPSLVATRQQPVVGAPHTRTTERLRPRLGLSGCSLVAAACLLAGACGQKGPLTLPAATAAKSTQAAPGTAASGPARPASAAAR